MKKAQVIKRLFCLLVIFIVVEVVLPVPHFVNKTYECVQWDDDNISATSNVSVYIHGVYWSSNIWNDWYNGVISIDSADEGKIGGKMAGNIRFSPAGNFNIGNMFYYNSKTNGYDSLGLMFVNRKGHSFLIQRSGKYSGKYIGWPISSDSDISNLLWAVAHP